MKRIALLAGGGKLPLIFADRIKSGGEYVIGLAIEGLTLRGLDSRVDRIYWGDVTEVERALEILRSEKINYIAMAGKIPKSLVFNRGLADNKIASGVFARTMDSRDYTLIKMVALVLRKKGVNVLDPTPYLLPLIPKKGVMTRKAPTEAQWQDIKFGAKAAKNIAGMDIGQAVVVKKRLVAAVEAIEGTDETIKRAGALVGEGAVIVKVARPRQDMRFDIPTIGPETIDAMISAKAAALAVEAKRTLMIDRGEIIRKADASGIVVVAI